MRLRTKGLVVSATLIVFTSLFSCKPPRTSVLNEGANMGKPQVTVPAPVEKREETDAVTPKERLDSGDKGVVPSKLEPEIKPFKLPPKKFRPPPQSF